MIAMTIVLWHTKPAFSITGWGVIAGLIVLSSLEEMFRRSR